MNHALAAVVMFGALVHGRSPASSPRFQQLYALRPDEGVFAYARISPDGRALAYASETRGARTRPTRTVTVVDLSDRTILFTEPGIDAYWSTDGQRMIYLSQAVPGPGSVSIRDHRSGAVVRDIAPVNLGDYFSWGRRDGKDLILTIASNYYLLEGAKGAMPASRVQPCEGIGVGDRPLLSKDGRQMTTFVRGTVVIRNLTDCGGIFDTGIRGAKADFSWDGRYVAMHAPKADTTGYEILVVDLQKRTVRTVTNLRGSSFFPSWTRNGRLCFRYDGDDYRGFMMADDVLAAPERSLPATSQQIPERRAWADIFPETPVPPQRLTLVTVWGSWSAHSPDALVDLQRARGYFDAQPIEVGVMTATDPGSRRHDIEGLLRRYQINLPEIPLAGARLPLTEAHNQIPTTLLFRDGVLVDRRLGAQSFDELRLWVGQRLNP
jgi:WD40 repeat protein